MKTGSRWLSVTLFSSESVVSIDVQAGEQEKNDVLAPNTKRSRSSKVSGSFNIYCMQQVGHNLLPAGTLFIYEQEKSQTP